MKRTVVTGAGGFVGRAVVKRLACDGWTVRAATRDGRKIPGASENVATGDLMAADLVSLAAGADVVVNCAARVHVLSRENAEQAERDYRAMNTELPLRLAEAARAAGAQAFVQISSAAAIASASAPDETVDDGTSPRPASPYGRSKLAADVALADLAADDFAVICLRPPAIYGPGVGAWFGLYNKAARLGLPMPLGTIENQRSYVFVDNVADGIVCACKGMVSGAYLLTDSEPISSAELYRRLLALHGRAGRVWKVPAPLVRMVGRLLLRNRAASLLGDAAFAGHRFAHTFKWQPAVSMHDALQKTVQGGIV
jgi:nucleoside-diphosphate-sugar epimerase